MSGCDVWLEYTDPGEYTARTPSLSVFGLASLTCSLTSSSTSQLSYKMPRATSYAKLGKRSDSQPRKTDLQVIHFMGDWESRRSGVAKLGGPTRNICPKDNPHTTQLGTRLDRFPPTVFPGPRKKIENTYTNT